MSLSAGTRLGPYEIEEAVGAGGMGEVYRAKDTRLDRTVAIKVMPDHMSAHPEVQQRFEREARTISSLQHPNICALYDVGHENGTEYLVMEYLEGETLAKKLTGGPLTTDEVLSIGVQMTDALVAAHKSGVVHRDLKPANVMLTKSGVKLLDFGLAKAAQVADTTSSITELPTVQHSNEPLTAKGTILGTFQYMAPEQLEGQDADVRSDIFALGAVLYEMATGNKAFAGKSQASLIASIMSHNPPDISSVQPMTPPALDRLIRTCLAKDADERWQTAHDVALQLKWIEEGASAAGIPKPVARRRRSRERTAWLVASIAIVAALVLTAKQFVFAPQEKTPIVMRFDVVAPDELVSFGSPKVSPDGRHIVFNGTDKGGLRSIWVRPLAALAAHPLPGTETAQRPFWSPDSKHIGFFASGKLKRVPLTGGPPLTVCEFANGSDGNWGANGVILMDGTFGDSVQAVPEGGGTPYAATRIDRDNSEIAGGWPHFFPDGKRFLFMAIRDDGPNQLRLGTLGSFETELIGPIESRIEFIEPGYLVFEREGTLLVQRFDETQGRLVGDPVPFAEGIGTGIAGLASFSGSASGTLIYTNAAASVRQLLWVDREGRELETVQEPDRYFNPAQSPDGKRLAVSVATDAGRSDVWTIDLERGVRTRLTFDDASDVGAVWSPDGDTILFSSDREVETTFLLYTKSAFGRGDATLIKIHDDDVEDVFGGQWLSDDRVLATARVTGNNFDVVSIDIRSGEVTPLVEGPAFEYQGAMSPDGQYVAYGSAESGGSEVYLTETSGNGRWQVSPAGGLQPKWRADGRELFYLGTNLEMMSVDVEPGPPLELGVPRRLFRAPVDIGNNPRNSYIAAPDGQKFLLVATTDRDIRPVLTVIVNWASELEEQLR